MSTTTTIELPCGAAIVTDKVCGKYYVKAVQICTGKNIIVLHSKPLRKIREVRAYLRKRLEMWDWNRNLTEKEIKARYKWMLGTKVDIECFVQYGLEPNDA